ncbi:MAG: class D beta-lactamase [Bacteroidia bacterium]|nr:class D beta-lactamase [Bacteroidia bacterium]
MKWTLVVSLLVFISCNRNTSNNAETDSSASSNDSLRFEVYRYFQRLLDSEKLDGVILIKHAQSKQEWSNDIYDAYKGFLPASTFKIPNTIIGLETGIIASENHVFKWSGNKHINEKWNQDLSLHDAFHYSCVPCYRELARKVGFEKMTQMLDKLKYGTMKVSPENLDLFWLEGASKISCKEQIDFLERLYFDQLGLKKTTTETMKRIMVIEKTADYTYSGKTGMAETEMSISGWFVGFVETPKDTYFFATHIEPKKGCNMEEFAAMRRKVTDAALRKLGVLK